jgi:hypothetical protein
VLATVELFAPKSRSLTQFLAEGRVADEYTQAFGEIAGCGIDQQHALVVEDVGMSRDARREDRLASGQVVAALT